MKWRDRLLIACRKRKHKPIDPVGCSVAVIIGFLCVAGYIIYLLLVRI